MQSKNIQKIIGFTAQSTCCASTTKKAISNKDQQENSFTEKDKIQLRNMF